MSQDLVNSVNKLTGQTTALLNEYIDAKAKIDGKVSSAEADAATATTKAASAEASALSAAQDRAAAEAAAQTASEVSGMGTAKELVAAALADSYQYAMAKAEFVALQEQRKREYGGSGLLGHRGTSVPSSSATFIDNIILAKTAKPALQGTNANLLMLSESEFLVDGVVYTVQDGFSDYNNANYGLSYRYNSSSVTTLGHLIHLPPSPDGTEVFRGNDGAGEVIDYKVDVDEKFGDVAATRDEAISRAHEQIIPFGDFRGGQGWEFQESNRGSAVYNPDGTWTITDTTGINSFGSAAFLVHTNPVAVKKDRTYILEVGVQDAEEDKAWVRVGGYGATHTIFRKLKNGTNYIRFTADHDLTSKSTVLLYAGGGSSATYTHCFMREADTHVIDSRKDLAFLEVWDEVVEETGTLAVLGNVQYQAATKDGVALKKVTDLGIAQGYSAFGAWDTETEGKLLSVTDLTPEYLQAFLSDPKNNCYFNPETNKLHQKKYRVRVVKGAGADWLVNWGDSFWTNFTSQVFAGNLRICAQGQLQETPPDLTYESLSGRYSCRANWDSDSTGFDRYVAGNVDYSQSISESGYCLMVPLFLLQRMNSGLYHPELNTEGCRKHVRNEAGNQGSMDFHESSRRRPQHSAHCFMLATYAGDSGYARDSSGTGDGISGSGRYDEYSFFDIVYPGQVEPLMLPVRSQETMRLLDDSGREAVRGAIRGKARPPRLIAITAGAVDGYDSGVGFYATTGNGGRFQIYGTLPDGRPVAQAVKEGDFVTMLNTSAVEGEVKTLKLAVTQINTDNIWMECQSQGKDKPSTVGWNSGSAGNDASHLYFAFHTYCDSSFDGLPMVNILGAPEAVQETFPNGVVGEWVPVVPDGTVKGFPFSRRCTAADYSKLRRVYTSNGGYGWGYGGYTFDEEINGYITNAQADTVMLFFYPAASEFTQPAINSAPIGGLGKTMHSSHWLNAYGGRLFNSLLGEVSKGKENYILGEMATESAVFTSSVDTLHTSASLWPTHASLRQIGVGTDQDSKAVKAMFSLIEKSGLLYLQMHGCEMVFDASTWGDNQKVPILSGGESRKTDTNGNAVKTFCHHTIYPVGIAHSLDGIKEN